MTISKTLKAFTSSLALGIGLIAMPTTAHAQIPVTDVASIGQDAANFLQTAAHYGSQVAHYAEQIQKYEQQITQLQQEYDSITGIKFSDILNKSNLMNTSRLALGNAFSGTSTQFGLGVPDTYTTEMNEYNARYSLLAPEELYPDNPTMQQQVRELQKTLYAVDAAVGEATANREQRLEIYSDLATKAASATDMKSALEVNNALLLENGRNLALLIELQSAQLSAESAQLRDQAKGKQVISSLFNKAGS